MISVWGAVDSFTGLLDGFYYIFTGENTSKVDKFGNLRSIKSSKRLIHTRVLGSVLRDVNRNKTSTHKMVQIAGL